MKQLTPSQFESLLLKPTRWIDVRAPVEFEAGAIPGAINLPLLTNEERHLVGLTYKQQGQQAAIDLGHQIVSHEVRDSRVQAWLKAVQEERESVIYCFRGGLRSQIVQSWLAQQGVERSIVQGGYKALRTFLIEVFETRLEQLQFRIIGGPTGSGKTAYLRASGKPFIDLEDLARHRGSAFGALEKSQPTQVDFENALAIEILRLGKEKGPILVESESRLIGQRSIPEAFFRKMKNSPRTEIEVPIQARVENIFRDYILKSSLGTRGDLRKFDDFRRAVTAISPKLGGLRSQEILQDLKNSQEEFESGRGLDSNRVWIAKLLEWYYDPSYRRIYE